MTFDPNYKNYDKLPDKMYCMLFKNDRMLVAIKNNNFNIPILNSEELNEMDPKNINYIGSIDSMPCFAGETSINNPSNLYSFESLFDIYRHIDEKFFWIAGRANHILNWSRNTMFCGKCGSKVENSTDERAKKCHQCGLVIYPRISPAVIVAVVKENKILLAKARRFRHPFYSVLAGFVEPGESLEECVMREIKEESGVNIKNIKYFGSQPWPFPDSLMVGFTAEYESGELIIDQKELVDAAWFDRENLPQIPTGISIARKLIDWFCENSN
jgi:NAD+ diphosphatase